MFQHTDLKETAIPAVDTEDRDHNNSNRDGRAHTVTIKC